MTTLNRAIALSILSVALHAHCENFPTITLQYSVRPPFMEIASDGSLVGTTAGPAVAAFKNAGVPFRLKEASPARRLLDVEENKTPVCSLGLYKTPQREKFGKFTNAVSQDTVMVALANRDLQVAPGITVAKLLQNPDMRILVKQSINYGPFLESKLARMKATRIDFSNEYSLIPTIIFSKRADLIFLPLEEAIYYSRSTTFVQSDFKILRFSEMPQGEKRHILCSHQVPDLVIKRLNQSLSKLPALS